MVKPKNKYQAPKTKRAAIATLIPRTERRGNNGHRNAVYWTTLKTLIDTTITTF
jgi:hypothetical protein